jgi:hypothetical protein
MVESISKFAGKTLLVSIPTLFGDVKCRPCTLVGAEIHGMWLRSEELIGRLLPSDNPYASAEPITFIPFTHVAAVLIATVPPGQVADTAAKATDAAPAVGRRPRAKSGEPLSEKRKA